MIAAPDAPAVLIAALSGRALAACARRGGYRPLVADLFGDLDTRDLAEASERVPGSLSRGFSQRALLASLDRLAAGRRVIGIVTGSGFEDRPRLLRSISARHVLLGNPAEVVTAVKDPFGFAEACARAGVAHPEVRHDRPANGDWLSKRTGGSGGVHVAASHVAASHVAASHVAASTRRTGSRHGRYYQCRVSGQPVSAAFLATAGACLVLGLSRQWADPAPRHPFRYGGASRPAPLTVARAADIRDAVTRLVSQTSLRGLNSADFLVSEDGLHLLEINPRPGATLDIFADRDGTLFRLHLDACNGSLPDKAPVFSGAAAAATVYARSNICLRPGFAWPSWAVDRQPSGEPVPGGAPFCTVLAEARDPTTAECLVRNRAAEILARAEGAN